jgi:hypothetical protein
MGAVFFGLFFYFWPISLTFFAVNCLYNSIFVCGGGILWPVSLALFAVYCLDYNILSCGGGIFFFF